MREQIGDQKKSPRLNPVKPVKPVKSESFKNKRVPELRSILRKMFISSSYENRDGLIIVGLPGITLTDIWTKNRDQIIDWIREYSGDQKKPPRSNPVKPTISKKMARKKQTNDLKSSVKQNREARRRRWRRNVQQASKVDISE